MESVALTDDTVAGLEQLLVFGRDEAGELYMLGGSGVHRIVPAS